MDGEEAGTGTGALPFKNVATLSLLTMKGSSSSFCSETETAFGMAPKRVYDLGLAVTSKEEFER